MQTVITLIDFSIKHVKQTFSWVQDPDLQRLFLMRGEVTWEGHQYYFNKVLADSSQRVYAIMYGEKHVGNCGLKNISSSKKEAEIWIYVGDPSMRGEGVGKFASDLLINKGFDCLRLEKVYVSVADFNETARSMYKGLGFVEVPLNDDAEEWKGRSCEIISMELNRRL